MRAVHLTDNGLEFTSNHQPQPDPHHISVRVLQAGICETDLQLVQGYMGFRGVLGHEFVGIAESGRYAGRRVGGEINCPCGDCDSCRRGMGNHCPLRTVLGILNHHGAFAEKVWLPEANLHPVPDSVSNEAAVLTEPLAAAFQIPAQLDLQKFDTLLVLGDGRLGQLCAQVLQLLGFAPRVVGKYPQKLQRTERLGIATALLDDMGPDRTADLVIDCTGSATGFPAACRLVRPRGTIVLKTTVAGETGPNLAAVVIDEIQVIGSRCGPFAPALQALADGSIDVAEMVTSRFPIEEAVRAFAVARQKDQLKVLLDIAAR